MRNAAIIVVLIAVALLLRIYVLGEVWWLGFDDANVYFVYVRNILEGNGIVYAHGGEWVEGFTSPLWLALLTLFTAPGWLSVEAVSLALGIVCLFGTLWVLHRELHKHVGLMFAWCGVVLLLLTPGFSEWMLTSRMETPLWVFVLAVAGLRIAYGPTDWWFFIAIAVLPLIRPEGFFLAPIIAVASVCIRDGINGRSLLKGLIVALLPVCVALALTGVRYIVFGVPLPNTYYAKVSASMTDNIVSGLYYMSKSMMYTMWLPVVLVTLSMVRLRKRPERTLAALVFVILLLPLLTGGDHFAYARFQVPALVFMWLLIIRAYATLGVRRRNAVLACVSVVVAMNINIRHVLQHDRHALHFFDSCVHNEYRVAQLGRAQADVLELIHAGGPLPRWGVIPAGGTAYGYRGECIDLMGLANAQMAHANERKTIPLHGHSSFNADVFFKQRPDVIHVFFAANDSMAVVRHHGDWDLTTNFVNMVLQNLYADPRFTADYGLARLTRDGTSIYGYVRRDWPVRAPAVHIKFLTITP